MRFEYTSRGYVYPNYDNLIMNTRFDVDDNSLVIEYSNGQIIRLDVTDLIGYEI
jgi:hypothetical protein